MILSSVPSHVTPLRWMVDSARSAKGILQWYYSNTVVCIHIPKIMYVACKITLSAPLKPSSIQATCAFFSLHSVTKDSAAIVPHIPPIHISTLPALFRLTERVWNKRSRPSVEHFCPVMQWPWNRITWNYICL